jgi:hypothetical protein
MVHGSPTSHARRGSFCVSRPTRARKQEGERAVGNSADDETADEPKHPGGQLHPGRGGMVMSLPSQVLLICGMPASGKTTFGNWLSETRGYIHLDLELKDCLTANGLPPFWSRRIWELDPPGVRIFVQHLAAREEKTVMTWGFAIDCLGLIEGMISAGAAAWWFEVDRLAAHQKFIERRTIIRDGVPQPGTPDPVRFDDQIGTLANHWAELAPVFGDRVIRTLSPDGTYLDRETILGYLNGGARIPS